MSFLIAPFISYLIFLVLCGVYMKDGPHNQLVVVMTLSRARVFSHESESYGM